MERFGRYELIKRIATGGMAEIFLARQAGLEGFEKLLVLKRILPHLAENEEFVEMFLHEARVAVRLNHPNVVTIFDLGKEDRAFFIAMEYIHGDDARRVWRQAEVQRNPIPLPLVCRIVMDAAAGLDYAHKKCDPSGQPLNIIHRDVSPQNILVSFEGAVKVVDFGIAKAADQASQTRSGVLKGKYSYMSPEQASGREIDQRTDQFALGVVLWELLTLKRLFKRGTDIQTLAAVTECKVPRPSDVNPQIPAEIAAITLKAMARNPDDRFRDLHEMQMALEEWLIANRQPSSPSHLAAYLGSIYQERLSREQAEGLPVFGGGSDAGSNSVDARRPGTDRRRTGLSGSQAVRAEGEGPQTRAARPGSRSGVSRAPQRVAAPEVAPAADPEAAEDRTPAESAISGSSVSRLVNRLSGRKKAAMGAAAMAVLVAAAGVLLWNARGDGVPLQEPEPGAAAPQAFAALKVVSNPPGAKLIVDGKLHPERTPTTIAGLALGEHRIFAELKGYLDEKRTVDLERDGEVVSLVLDLQREAPVAATLQLQTNPPGAELTVDGKPVGKSPLTLELTAGRTVDIEATRDGYFARRQSITLGEGPQQVAIELERRLAPAAATPPAQAQPGTLVITSDPPAIVWEGAKELGPTPLKVRLPAGKHQLALVNKEEQLSYGFSVVLKPDETVTRPFRFERGEVQVVVKPVTMDAVIYLRSKRLGTNPLPRFPLLEGEYLLVVVNEELKKSKKVPVTVKPNELTKVVVDMAGD